MEAAKMVGPGEHNKGKVCHITVLNPATHARIFHKLARSQFQMGWDVCVVGQDHAAKPYFREGIRILPIKPFARLNWKRVVAFPFWVMRYIRHEPADLYWLHSPELVGLGLLLKCRGKKVVYDVHEDYFRTIRFAQHYPYLLRICLAPLLRMIERVWVRALDAVVYAEMCYDNMLGVPEKRKWILRNTFSPYLGGKKSLGIIPPQPYLLYTGTIAEAWGVFRTLELWRSLRKKKDLHLVIAGSTQLPRLLTRIHSWLKDNQLESHFTLLGGEEYLPHEDILYLIAHCWAGTALYEITPIVKGKIPTKFYEFMALGKALIFTRDSFWEGVHAQHPVGVPWETEDEVADLIRQVDHWHSTLPASAYSWEEDEKQLTELMRQIAPT